MTDTDKVEDEWMRQRRIENEHHQRALDLQERQVVLQERVVEAGNLITHQVDDALARMTAFWKLPPEQQAFRLREEAVGYAIRLGGTIDDVLANAGRIIAYIVNSDPSGTQETKQAKEQSR